MKQKILLLFFSILVSSAGFSQRETTWWYFGNGTGLDFTKVLDGVDLVPTKVSGPIATGEGCCALSDYNGNLLMASDGRTVYNKNRAVMKNGTGLLGHESSSQSSIVMARPSHPNQYYIVTVPDYATGSGTANGINYSIVDLSLEGGLGEVTEKNKPLYTGDHLSSPPGNEYGRTNIYENIGAVQHSNGNDYWLVHRFRQYFYIWFASKDGIGPDPIRVVPIGHDPGTDMNQSPGNIKFSKDGRFIAHAGWAGLALGHFDTTTGDITNISHIPATSPFTNRLSYSCEFSPSGEYLYFNVGWGTYGSYRVNTNVSLGAQTAVQYNTTCKGYGMQLGPDGKIYSFDQYILWVIEDPDAGGTNVSFYPGFFTYQELKHPQVSHLALNLPTFAMPRMMSLNLPNEICANNSNLYVLNFAMPPAISVDHLEWNFGDGTIINDSDFLNPVHSHNHTYAKSGNYTLTITPYKDASKTTPITEWATTKLVKVSSCIMPVNPNIHIFH